jgi:hypothetical protein
MIEYQELLSVKRFIDVGSPPIYLMPTTSTGYLA